MSAEEFLTAKHGTSLWLSRDAIVQLLNEYSDNKFEEYKRKKEVFNTERWVAEETFRRNSFPKKKG